VLDWVKDREHLQEVQEAHGGFFVLAFWGDFSDAAERSLAEIKEFSRQHDQIPVYVVDVKRLKGLHKAYDVKRVPTVLAVEKGEVTKFIEGVQSARFYAVHLSGAGVRPGARTGQSTPRRAIVYSGPGCPACGQLKAYLRRHGVPFREVDISRDHPAAESIMRRSGMMAVPQTDIGGRLVVGFDRAKLDGLLGIQSEGRER